MRTSIHVNEVTEHGEAGRSEYPRHLDEVAAANGLVVEGMGTREAARALGDLAVERGLVVPTLDGEAAWFSADTIKKIEVRPR